MLKAFARYQMSAPRARACTERGWLVSRLLAGSWRGAPAKISPEELNEIGSLLVNSGAGGLAWCAVRNSYSTTSPGAPQLQQAYRFHSLQGAVSQRNLKLVLQKLRAADVEPVLVKGWSIARLYPEIGMRSYADLDLCVPPAQYSTAQQVLKEPIPECDVDLHSGFGKFYASRKDDLFGRSQLVRLDNLDVRILSDEDHMRFLCMHMLRHGAARPLWLCDIAVLLESRGDNFDWDQCLSGSRRQIDWVACSIGLAHQLLGAKVEGTPVARRANNLPKWLVPAVLKVWGAPYGSQDQISVYLRNQRGVIRGLLKELPNHWPNPVRATATVRGPFNELPRFPFQIGHVISRTGALISELPSLLGGRSS